MWVDDLGLASTQPIIHLIEKISYCGQKTAFKKSMFIDQVSLDYENECKVHRLSNSKKRKGIFKIDTHAQFCPLIIYIYVIYTLLPKIPCHLHGIAIIRLASGCSGVWCADDLGFASLGVVLIEASISIIYIYIVGGFKNAGGRSTSPIRDEYIYNIYYIYYIF